MYERRHSRVVTAAAATPATATANVITPWGGGHRGLACDFSSAVVNGKGGDLIRFFADAQDPKDKWPSLLGSGSLCSAVGNCKGDDLIRFLDKAQIPKDKRPSLPGSNSLCSAAGNGKGGYLFLFLTEAQIAQDKWPSLLASGSLCSAIQRGKGPLVFQPNLWSSSK